MKKKADAWLVRFVCHFARPVPVRNIVALVFIPAVWLGFLWGYLYPLLIVVLNAKEISAFMKSTGLVNWTWLIAPIPILFLTFVMLYPICKAIAICVPDKFQEELFDDSAML
jgi:hypothetical protein